MEDFGLLLGHLVGDYLFQDDWQAANKVNPWPGKEPHPGRVWVGTTIEPRDYPGPWSVNANPADRVGFASAMERRNQKISEWDAKEKLLVEEARARCSLDNAERAEQRAWCDARLNWWVGNAACLYHCLWYTFAVALFSWSWMPWWGLAFCFLTHFVIDRFKLARWWMMHISRQEKFATGPLAPWSIIIVDNTWHLLTLYLIACIHWG